jgi:hypothetical protein
MDRDKDKAIVEEATEAVADEDEDAASNASSNEWVLTDSQYAQVSDTNSN